MKYNNSQAQAIQEPGKQRLKTYYAGTRALNTIPKTNKQFKVNNDLKFSNYISHLKNTHIRKAICHNISFPVKPKQGKTMKLSILQKKR